MRLVALVAGAALLACSVAPTAPATSPSASVTGTPTSTIQAGSEGSTCGELVDYAVPNPTEQLLTLQIRAADQSTRRFRYRLVGPGTAPSDVSTQFVAGVKQVLFISGRFTPTPPSQTDFTVTSFSVMRIAEPCPVTL